MRCPARQISMRLNIHNKILIAYMIFSRAINCYILVGSRTEWHGAHWVADIKCSLLGFAYWAIGIFFWVVWVAPRLTFFFGLTVD